MMKMQLDPHHWCVVQTFRESGEPWSESTRGLANAFTIATRYINELGVRSVVIFDGQPSDGAKLIARINLDGVS